MSNLGTWPLGYKNSAEGKEPVARGGPVEPARCITAVVRPLARALPVVAMVPVVHVVPMMAIVPIMAVVSLLD